VSDAGDVPGAPRPTILRGLAPEALAVGYDGAERRWVTAAEAGAAEAGTGPGPRFDPLPPLDGVVVVAEAGLVAAAGDFGHLVSRRPSAVLRPGSHGDVAAVVRFARAHGLRVGARGQAHTLFGQSQVDGGVLVDMSPLAAVGAPAGDRIEVDGGALWSSVLSATLAHDLVPPVLTDYLELSVAGTLSVGGVGGTSWRFGAQVDNVDELTVVTGDGELVRCSESVHRDLFEAALAGQGQCCVIVAACLRLVPARPLVRVVNLFYADLPSMTADIRLLIDDGRFDYVVGFVVPGPGGWITYIEALKFHRPASPPDDAALTAGLGFVPGGVHAHDTGFFDYARRVTVQLDDLRAAGLQPAPNPWIDLFVPDSQVDGFVGGVLESLTPADLGRSFPILLYPFKRSVLRRPLFRVPDEEACWLFDILRAATPGATEALAMVEQNDTLLARNLDLGGTLYPISAVHVSRDDWRRLYEPHWDELVQAKRRYDPDNVLSPGPGVF
jgi:cytokinin dehydrogenase